MAAYRLELPGLLHGDGRGKGSALLLAEAALRRGRGVRAPRRGKRGVPFYTARNRLHREGSISHCENERAASFAVRIRNDSASEPRLGVHHERVRGREG